MKNTIYSVSKMASQHPERTAYKEYNYQISYQMLWHNSLCLYHNFKQSGCKQGEYIWINIQRGDLFVSAVMAAYMCGIHSCLIADDILASKPKEAGMEVSPDCLLNDDIIVEDYHKLAKETNPSLVISDCDVFSFCINGVQHQNISSVVDGKAEPEPIQLDLPPEYEDGKLIFFTSATTSNSKAVISTYGQFNFSELDMNNAFSNLNGITRTGYIKPFFSGEMSTLQEGGTIFFFDIKDDEQLIRISNDTLHIDHLLTNLFGLKRFNEIHNKHNLAFTSIEAVTITGGAMHRLSKIKAEETFPNAVITDMYGQTELGAISSIDSTEWYEDPYCVGYPSFFNRVQIMSKGETVPDGSIGDICVSSRFAYEGYIGQAVRNTPYVITGDIGYIKQGKLYYLGRRSEMINLDSKWYFVRQLEALLVETCPKNDVAVFAKDNFFYVYVASSDDDILVRMQDAISGLDTSLTDFCQIISVEKIEYSKNQKPILPTEA